MAIRRHMSPEQQQRTAEWCFRLKSKRYKQGKGLLHYIITTPSGEKEDYYCCLGVAAEYACEEGVVDKIVTPDAEQANREIVRYGDRVHESGIFNDKLAEWFGTPDLNPQVKMPVHPRSSEETLRPLAGLNDAGVHFERIADLIAKTWLDEPLRSKVLNYAPSEDSK